MIVSPDWSTLRDVAAGLDGADPVQRQKALERVLQLITAELSDTEAVRLYVREGQMLVVRAATDWNQKTAKPLTAIPLAAAALNRHIDLWLPEEGHWSMPLLRAGQAYGVLEVQTPQLDGEWSTWLSIIADRVAKSLALAEQHPTQPPAPTDKRVTGTHVTTSARMLNAAETFADLTAALMLTAEQEDVLALALTLFEQPLEIDGQPNQGISGNRRYVRIFTDGEITTQPSRDDTFSSLPSAASLTDLRQGLPLVVQDIAAPDDNLSEWLRDRAINTEAEQVAIFGLASADVVVGTLDLLLKHDRTLSEAEVDLYTTLAQQTGASILSKRLLQQSLEAQQFASQLVKTNRAIASAESYTQMAQAVLGDAPESVQAVAIALFDRPSTSASAPNSVRAESIVTRQGQLSLEEHRFVDYLGAVEDARVSYFLQEYLDGSMMTLWSTARPRDPVVAQTLVERLKQEPNIDVIVSFGLNMSNSLRGLLLFAGQETLREPGPQYDGLRAIADQLAAVIENRILLEQTTSALDLMQSQYRTSSRVFQSGDPTEMLLSIYQFAGNVHDRAELAIIGADDVTRVVAQVDEQGQAHTRSHSVSLADYPASQALTALEALEVHDVAENTFITDAERAALQADGTASLIILPLTTDHRLSGLIALTREQPSRLSPERLRAMRSLADQIGVVLENRKLLRGTEDSLKEMQSLYEMNRAMLRTQDIMDVLRSLKWFVAPEAYAITYTTLHRAPSDIDAPPTRYTLDSVLLDDDERILERLLTDDPQALAETNDYLHSLDRRVIFSSSISDVPPAAPAHHLSPVYPAASYVSFLIYEDGQVVNIIHMLFEEPRTFTTAVQRQFRAAADQVSITIENQKLLRASQQSAMRLSAQVERLEQISDFATYVNTTQGERDLLDSGARAVVDMLDIDHTGIVLLNEDLQTGVIASEYPATGAVGNIVTMKDSPILKAAGEETFFAVSDVATSSALSPAQRDGLLNQGVGSILIVSLIGLNGELLGSMGLDVYEPHHQFTESDIRTAQTVAAQMAIGIQNVRLLQEAQQRAEQLQQISDFSQSAQSTLDISSMVDAALVNIPRLLSVSHMTIALSDQERDALTMTGGWYEENSLRTQLEGGQPVPLNGTTSGYVYQTGRYLYIPNLHTRVALRYPHSRTITSLLAMPVINRGQTLGVVSIGSHRAEAYTDTDIALFQQMVNQMAVAMDNARAYTQNQRIAENKTLANEISVQLQRQNDITDMVDLTLREVGRAIGAKRGRVRLSADREPRDTNDSSNGV